MNKEPCQGFVLFFFILIECFGFSYGILNAFSRDLGEICRLRKLFPSQLSIFENVLQQQELSFLFYCVKNSQRVF